MKPDYGVERLAFFSDGVIAITITLLVIELRVPAHVGAQGDAELWRTLISKWPNFLAYFVSFVVIGIFWVSHHRKFASITRASLPLIWLNMAFLMMIGLIPFTTSLIAENAGAVGTAVYAVVMSMVAISLSAIWAYADHVGLVDSNMDELERRRELLVTLLGAAVFLLSLALVPLHVDVAKAFWLLLIPINIARIGRVKKRKQVVDTHHADPAS